MDLLDFEIIDEQEEEGVSTAFSFERDDFGDYDDYSDSDEDDDEDDDDEYSSDDDSGDKKKKKKMKHKIIERIETSFEIGYNYFCSAIWPKLNSTFHPSLVWTEIMSYIKGSF